MAILPHAHLGDVKTGSSRAAMARGRQAPYEARAEGMLEVNKGQYSSAVIAEYVLKSMQE